jgi:hypothetical protein
MFASLTHPQEFCLYEKKKESKYYREVHLKEIVVE